MVDTAHRLCWDSQELGGVRKGSVPGGASRRGTPSKGGGVPLMGRLVDGSAFRMGVEHLETGGGDLPVLNGVGTGIRTRRPRGQGPGPNPHRIHPGSTA